MNAPFQLQPNPARVRDDRMWDIRRSIVETFELAVDYGDLHCRYLALGDDARADDAYGQMITCFKEITKLRAELADLRKGGAL
jgi:hypothetical protein